MRIILLIGPRLLTTGTLYSFGYLKYSNSISMKHTLELQREVSVKSSFYWLLLPLVALWFAQLVYQEHLSVDHFYLKGLNGKTMSNSTGKECTNAPIKSYSGS